MRFCAPLVFGLKMGVKSQGGKSENSKKFSESSKSESLNPKQYRKSNVQMTKTVAGEIGEDRRRRAQRGLRPQPKGEDRLLRIRRMFFAFAFLFAASPSCEGGEKRTTAKNSEPNIRYWY
ncbi:MAG: hypothetical protein ISS79_05475 [Phycisphaerae bacterium]|nr:hypothetical protein [Phycisphaerae bacterium]